MIRRLNALIRSTRLHTQAAGWGGVLQSIKGKVAHTTQSVRVTRADCRHPFEIRLPSSDLLVFEQVFVDREYDFVSESSPHTIVDAGANIGLASIYFANRYPDAKIVAIEPEVGNFALLTRNVAPYPNVVPVQSALWHRDEELNLTDPGLGNWGFTAESKTPNDDSRGQTRHSVPAMTIPTLMERFGMQRINILKMDIEGGEKEVFSDSSEWLTRVDAIIIELHERMKPGCNRSFYTGSSGFDREWLQGENVYLSRPGIIAPHPG